MLGIIAQTWSFLHLSVIVSVRCPNVSRSKVFRMKPDKVPMAVKTDLGSTIMATRNPFARSRVSNGSDLLPNIDGRSAIARRYRDITAAVMSDMGGIDRCSETRIQLVRRFAACAVLTEQLEARLANGEQIEIAEHALLTSSMVRVAQRIGMNRRTKEIPELFDYVKHRKQTDEE